MTDITSFLGSREDSNPVENNRISVEFVLYAYDNKTNVAGDTAWIGAALEIGDDTIWAGQMMVTLVDNLAAPALVSKYTHRHTGKNNDFLDFQH